MKTCSKTLFKKWIDDVRRAYRRIPEIKDKLAYYESQLDGYHAVTYDSVRVKTYGNSQEMKLLLTLEKMDEYQNFLIKYENIIENYYSFLNVLNDLDIKIVAHLVESNTKSNEIYSQLEISKSTYYNRIAHLGVLLINSNNG